MNQYISIFSLASCLYICKVLLLLLLLFKFYLYLLFVLWFWYILCHLKLIALIGKYQSVLSVHADYVALQEMVRSVIMHLSAASDPLETLSGSVCCFFCLCPVTHQWEHGLLVRAHKTLCFSFLRSINTESKWSTGHEEEHCWSLMIIINEFESSDKSCTRLCGSWDANSKDFMGPIQWGAV